MLNFLGSYDAKLDTKARVFVPATFRKILQASSLNSLILRRDIFQECLILYPLVVWEEEIAKLRSKLNRWDKEQQQLFRQFVMNAEKLDIDTNGRILVPKKHLQMVGIESEVIFLGVDNTIEVWAKENLNSIILPNENFSYRIQDLMNNNP